MTPKRIQRKRTAGWRMPENTVYVGRPSRWGNPFHVELYPKEMGLSKEQLQKFAVNEFEHYLRIGDLDFSVEDVRECLKGKNLACWCEEGTPCHGDVLLQIANGPNPTES